MGTVWFLTHPEVVIDPAVPVPEWRLSARGRARMEGLAGAEWMAGVRSVWCSAERKARDGAEILAGHLGLAVRVHAGLGENDRSATGYLPREAFERMVAGFFGRPEESVQGWERAMDAQARVVGAMRAVCRDAPEGDLVVVSHGGVGALLLAHVAGAPIERGSEQPGATGGCLFAFARAGWALRWGWRMFEA